MIQDININKLVEIITINCDNIIGVLTEKYENYFILQDPCKIKINKNEISKENTLQITTDILPQRIAGDKNFGQFYYHNILSISEVNSDKFNEIYINTINEYNKLYLHSSK